MEIDPARASDSVPAALKTAWSWVLLGRAAALGGDLWVLARYDTPVAGRSGVVASGARGSVSKHGRAPDTNSTAPQTMHARARQLRGN